MVEGLSVVLQLTAQVPHPVDVELAICHVEGSWVEALAQGLALNEAVQDAVHRDLGLKLLIARSHTPNEVMSQCSTLVTGSNCLLDSCVILE